MEEESPEEAIVIARLSTRPIRLGFGPFWFPGGPLFIVFLILSISSNGWAKLTWALLALASLCLLVLHTVNLIASLVIVKEMAGAP